jgi:hypothetical protein
VCVCVEVSPRTACCCQKLLAERTALIFNIQSGCKNDVFDQVAQMHKNFALFLVSLPLTFTVCSGQIVSIQTNNSLERCRERH